MKSAIVTGANGFVGRYLVEELAAQGYEVWAVIRDARADTSCLKAFGPHIVYCDLAEIKRLPERMPQIAGGTFYHLAWGGSSGSARADYALQMQNATACADTAKAAREIGCSRFIGAGSITELVYRDYLHQDGIKTEMIACYAIGKLAAEYLTRCICDEVGMAYNWTYIANFYGAQDNTQNFINFLIKSYLRGETPSLTDGMQYTDFTYVSDVARALSAVGEHGVPGHTYYVGYGRPQPLREYVLVVRNAVAPTLDAGLGRKKLFALPIDYSRVDVEKLHRETGFVPAVDFVAGIQKTLQWITGEGGR